MRSHRHLDQVGPLISTHSRLAFLAAALLVTTGSAQNEEPLPPASTGASSAPVTVYEMPDFQRPACRLFSVTVLPILEREYVQTGKVRWVFINLPLTSLHPNAIAAAEVAMCAARQGRFWPTHDALYQQQDDWAKLAKPRTALVRIAQRAGVDRAKLLACLSARSVRREIDVDAHRASRSGAPATPALYIEGGLLQGAPYTRSEERRVGKECRSR